jgi:hypothetical protein
VERVRGVIFVALEGRSRGWHRLRSVRLALVA